MYISLLMLKRLIILPILYMVCIFIWWNVFEVYILLLAIIPLVAFVLCFSYPVLNYLSLLGFSFLVLYTMKISIKNISSTFLFWGIQAFLLSVALCVSIIRSKIPTCSVVSRKKKRYFINDKEDQIVHINVQLKTITSITRAACKLYGWKQKNLLNQSVSLIHLCDLWFSPPHDFWRSLETTNKWCGFIDVITKEKIVFEEKSYYRAIKDNSGQIVMLEKKIIDIFLKEQSVKKSHIFFQFYEEFPQPMAIINKNFQIENANPEFMKITINKPKISMSRCLTIFDQKIHNKLLCAINEAFEGNRSQFTSEFHSIRGTYQAEYIFSPYINPKYNTITHVLLMLKLETLITNRNTNIIDNSIQNNYPLTLKQELPLNYKNKERILEPRDIFLLDILQQSITSLYKNSPYSTVKLYGSNIKGLVVCSRWELMISQLLIFMDSMNVDQKKIVISCVDNVVDNIIKISFTNVLYTEYKNIKDNQLCNNIQDTISEIGRNMSVVQGTNKELILSFLYSKLDENTS